MNFIYNLAFLAFGVVYLPHFLSKLKQAEDPHRLLAERMGLFSEEWKQRLLGKKIVWLHAVSVGEVFAVQNFLEKFLERWPEYHVVLTTVTPTGQRIAKKMEGKRITACYFPFDLTPAVRNFFSALQPELLLLAETEIWPNLLTEAGRFRVPVGILNARLSAKSASRYEHFRFFFQPLFRRLDFVLAQTGMDARRFAQLGVDPGKIEVFGNMKFDNVSLDLSNSPSPFSLKREWHFDPQDRILIAGSTHPGEEEILARVFLKLRGREPFLRMVIAPRHIERSERLAERLRRHGLRVRMSLAGSSQNTAETHPEQSFDVLILNQLGILKSLYAMADVVFMGGSLVRRGGQNPIEPAGFKRAILHGPHVHNFEKIYQLFDQEGAALSVRDEAQLAFALKRLLENESERSQLGENAFAVLQKLQGATERALGWFLDFLSPGTPSERTNNVEFHEKLFPSAGGRT